MSPWVRLQENALDHPKLLGLVDFRRPFDLWVWGLSYAQKHLTDGLVPRAALPKGSEKAAGVLTSRGLWDASDAGFQIHDYHDWNESREVVEAKRLGARKRAAKSRTLHDHRAPHGAVGYVEKSSDLPNTGISDPTARVIADDALGDRARDFLEKYRELYQKHRFGARLSIMVSAVDFQKACELCATWDSGRLEKMAAIFLTTDDDWISKTDRKFRVFAEKATWCDDRLAVWEASQRRPA